MIARTKPWEQKKRLEKEAIHIAQCATAYGDLDAMEKFGIGSLQTLHKYVEKGGGIVRKTAVSDRAMHPTAESYFDNLVSAIVRKISLLQNKSEEYTNLLSSQQETIQQQEHEIRALKKERDKLESIARTVDLDYEESVFQQLNVLVKT